MRHIDEDTITQAVIARHAAAGDARLREVMTSLVQHLHAFAREVKLTEAEWAAGLDFIAACGRRQDGPRAELALLSDALGLSTLVQAQQRRTRRGGTERAIAGAVTLGAVDGMNGQDVAPLIGEPCHVRGRVGSTDGRPLAGAEVQIVVPGRSAAHGTSGSTQRTDADGVFAARVLVPPQQAIAHDGPVGGLLDALGRTPWRPAHLQFVITAPGHERLVTQVFRQGDRHLDADAVFGVRSALVADWVRHGPGRMPDGHASAVPFTTLEFSFVLNANTTTGDTP
jgi:hydroxyquinol 1,2-dioxygenase